MGNEYLITPTYGVLSVGIIAYRLAKSNTPNLKKHVF